MSARLRRLLRGPVPAPVPEAAAPDGGLVCRFVETRDEAAFAELVRRHGPMVLAACRRVLGPDAHTADDAFQATFLVLATRAAKVSPPERVGAWLHGVAVRVAQKARAWARKIAPAHPGDLDAVPDPVPAPDAGAAEFRARIDDALAGLPSRYRSAVVLCELEGRSRKEAAAALGWSEGTLSSRLARARKLLADRLARRGVTLPAAGLGALVPAAVAPGAVPVPLAAQLARTAALLATGALTDETVPAPVAALARAVSARAAPARALALGLTVAALVLGGVGLFARATRDRAALPLGEVPQREPAPRATKGWVLRHTFERDAAITTVALGADLVAAADARNRITLWDAKTGAETEGLGDFPAPAASPALARIDRIEFTQGDAQLVLVTGGGDSGHRFTLTPGDRGGTSVRSKGKGPGSERGRVLGVTSDGAHWLWGHPRPPRSGALVLSATRPGGSPPPSPGDTGFDHPAPVEFAAGTNEGAIVTVAGGVLRRWQGGADRPLWEVDLTGAGMPEVTGLRVSPGGRRIAVTGAAGPVRVFDARDGATVATPGPRTGAVRAAAFGPDQRHLVVGGADHEARVYDAGTGEELAVLEGHTAPVTAVAFGPDGDTIVTGSADRTVRVWERRRASPPAIAIAPPVRAAAPVPKGAREAGIGAVFGALTDPDTKSVIEPTKDGGLRITVPAAADSVVPPSDAPGITRGAFVPPQVARIVRGDFALTVRVTQVVPDGAQGAPGAARATASAGLAVTDTTGADADGKDPAEVRFVCVRDKGRNGWAPWRTMYHQERGVLAGGSMFVPLSFERNELSADGSVYLRLVREGDELTARTSPDGKRWTSLGLVRLQNLGPELRVGPVAFQSTDRDYTATFSEYEFKSLKGDEWATGRDRPAPASAEERAVQFVADAGGWVTRDPKRPGNPIIGVRLTGAKITDAGLKELAALKGITFLDLTSCVNVTDAGLKELAGFAQLTNLDLSNCEKVTDAGLKALAGLTGLTRLGLSGCAKVTDTGLGHLAALGNLTSLGLDYTRATDRGMSALAGLKGLATLNLASTGVGDAGLMQLAGLAKLTDLNLAGTRITDAGAKELAGLTELERLVLTDTRVADAGAKDLARLRKLRNLVLTRTLIGDPGLKEVIALESLRYLEFAGCEGVTDATLERVVRLANLTHLNLSGCKRVTDAGLTHVTALKKLTFLNLDRTRVTDAGLKELAGIKELTLLTLCGTSVTDAGLKDVARLENLTSLWLVGTKVTDAGLKELASLKKLQSLDLPAEGVTEAGLTELQKVLGIWSITRH